MDPRFFAHNRHHEGTAKFRRRDPQLAYLATQKYAYQWPLVNRLPVSTPGIYTLGGGRQIGKTTLLKQWMFRLLKEGIDGKSIAYFTGELIDDHHTLLHLIENQLQTVPENKLNFLIIDEVTYIKEWDKAIKFAADAGMLRNTVLMITGSDLSFLEEARNRFPGRRGKADIVDFHLYPLSFREFVQLKEGKTKDVSIKKLFSEFDQYLIHGGFLTAINDYAETGKISYATLVTYSDWIRGDVVKRHKQERYLREIFTGIIRRYNSQITWNNLAKDLSIDHPKTVVDYLSLLESMDCVFIQAALIEEKLVGAPKKARKITFTDPFIHHAIQAWLSPTLSPYETQILKSIQDPNLCGSLVEACVVSHYRRYFPTYYIKGTGEVDLAYIDQDRFWPIEVKWTKQLRSADLQQISKYSNGRILSKQQQQGSFNQIPVIPVPLALYQLKDE